MGIVRRAIYATLSVSLRTIDRLGRGFLFPLSPDDLVDKNSYGFGISVVIPERDTPQLLAECIESVLAAAGTIPEPVEVVVVVNGSSPKRYEVLVRRFALVRWAFLGRALGFNEAVRQGLKIARYDWVYLLNSDMTVDPQALSALMPWRAPQVFAIASQIYFKDASLRREETGWTKFRDEGRGFEIFDAPVEDGFTRGTLYAGGGASLFRKALLKRFAAETGGYKPFYWEDVEWGTVAWRCGFESLFCPASMVWHHHRATNRLFYSEGEIDRIFRRNRVLYELRNRIEVPEQGDALFDRMHALDRVSFLELMSPGRILGILRSRFNSCRYPFHRFPLQFTWRKYYVRPWLLRAQRPTVILVTPYAIYPPSHGGAVRLYNLIRTLTQHFDVVLLSDEADQYVEGSLKYFDGLASVHLIGGRQDSAGDGRIQRIVSHSHSGLMQVLQMLLERYAPDLVQVEFVELAKLVEARPETPLKGIASRVSESRLKRVPWLLTMHEVWIAGDVADASDEDRYEMDVMSKYDAVIACSEEDARLIVHPAVHVVPNGADVKGKAYCASPEQGPILFIGPFRYQPNLVGIRTFLEQVYPGILRAVPWVRLWVLGGHGAFEATSGMDCFRQKGVTVMNYIERPRPLLDQCAFTINPLLGVRGSCLKIAESIAAGRVCVSTIDGARGFRDHGAPGLIAVESVADFREHVCRLLSDPACRHSLERPRSDVLDRFSWEGSGRELLRLYAGLLGGRKDMEGKSASPDADPIERNGLVIPGV